MPNIISVSIDLDQIPVGNTQQELKLLVGTLQEFAVSLTDAYGTRVVNQYTVGVVDPIEASNAQIIESRITGVLTKMAGVVSGYTREVQTITKYARKGRSVHSQMRGDVAVDYAPGYGKAYQLKSTFSEDYRAVDNMIAEAANQLTGERDPAETPMPGDRRIIDITINNKNNPWPATTSSGLPRKVNDMISRINSKVTTYKAHGIQVKKGVGYSQNKFNQLTHPHQFPHQQTDLYSDINGKLISRIYHVNPFGNQSIVIDLVVKVKFGFAGGVPILLPDNRTIRQSQTQIVFRVTNNGINYNTSALYSK